MTEVETPQFRFERTLRIEAERVLEDVIFVRSPVQSKLLRYLVERSSVAGAPPTQYEIAVDGLDRSPDYDLESDSYPRVQISRLRRNLDDYYARNLPHAEMRISIDPTAYRLILVPVEPSDKDKASTLPPPPDHFPEPEESAIVSDSVSWWKRPTLLVTGLGVILAVAIYAFTAFFPSSSKNVGPPSISISIDRGSDEAVISEMAPLALVAEQVSEIRLSDSMVSTYAGRFDPKGSGASKADYHIEMRFGYDGRGEPVAHLSLLGREGNELIANTIPYDKANPVNFNAELEATLIYITSPTGIVATDQLAQASDPLASDYLCFIAVESRRGDGASATAMVDTCIDSYPDSKYAAYWYTRRAFAGYQADRFAGRPLLLEGAPWKDLERAFEIDPYNAFANFLAAKVELSTGRCNSALTYVSNALERGSSYPALLAAIEGDVEACSERMDDKVFNIDRVSLLARYNPSPDPLLHLYMMVAAVSIGDEELAQLLSSRSFNSEPRGPVEMTSHLLNQSVQDPAFARAHREELRTYLSIFIWNPKEMERIIDSLEKE